MSSVFTQTTFFFRTLGFLSKRSSIVKYVSCVTNILEKKRMCAPIALQIRYWLFLEKVTLLQLRACKYNIRNIADVWSSNNNCIELNARDVQRHQTFSILYIIEIPIRI